MRRACDPAWLIGAPVPQLGTNAGAGEGYLVVEGDESDRTVFSLPAEIAVVTNIELDHHSEFASLADLRAAFDAWLATVGSVVRDAAPYDGELALPGELNRLNAGTALAALEAVGVSRRDAAPVIARFTGTGRRFEVHPHASFHDRRRLRASSDRDRQDDRGGTRALPAQHATGLVPTAPLLADATSGG